MPVKRPRRASPSVQGLSAGERLKRVKLASHDHLAWAWVGTDVRDPAEITQEHCSATCGFSDTISSLFCVNRFREPPELQPKEEVADSPVAEGELEDDIIVVTDDDSPAVCSPKVCKSNPNCLNYLSQEKWENEGAVVTFFRSTVTVPESLSVCTEKARSAFMKCADLGDDPDTETRVGQIPVGLKVRPCPNQLV